MVRSKLAWGILASLIFGTAFAQTFSPTTYTTMYPPLGGPYKNQPVSIGQSGNTYYPLAATSQSVPDSDVLALTADGWTTINPVSTGGGATGANPTGTVGLTAVNGSATTFMRSDGSAPLSQSINPTWTGTHTFNGGFGGTGVATYLASPPSIGITAAAAGAFTTLGASGVVSGVGFTNYFAAPPAIGGTTPNTGAFTTLNASSTVSGAGFTSLFSAPSAIGNTTPNTGAFTTLNASSTVSGAGFTSLFAAPPAIGSTTPGTGAFTTINGTVITASSNIIVPNGSTGSAAVQNASSASSGLYFPSATTPCLESGAKSAGCAGSQGTFNVQRGIVSAGATATVTGCSPGTVVGGAEIGTFTVGAGASPCTFVATINGGTGATAPTNWVCVGFDTTSGIVLVPTGTASTTTCSFKGNAATSDVIVFSVLRGY